MDMQTIYVAMVKSAHDAIIGLTFEGAVMAWNAAAEEIFGYSRQEILGKHVSMLDPLSPQGGWEESLGMVAGNKPMAPYEAQWVSKDGTPLTVSVRLSPIQDDKGAKAGASAIVRQMNGHTPAETALAAANSAALDALVMVDDSGKITFWSRAAEEIFGYAAGEAMGQDVHRLLAPPDVREKARKALAEYAKSGKGETLCKVVERTAMRKDTTYFPVYRRIVPANINGQWHALGSIQDISARKSAELKLQELAPMDSLTGVLNRKHFIEFASKEVSRSKRYGNSLSFLAVEIDNYAGFVQENGKDAGEHALQIVAQLVSSSTRREDLIGRLGAEQFGVILLEATEETAATVANGLRELIAYESILTTVGVLKVTVSFSVVGFNPNKPDVLEILQDMERGMSQARRQGGNRVIRI